MLCVHADEVFIGEKTQAGVIAGHMKLLSLSDR